MKFLDQILSETLRVKSPVPMQPVENLEDFTLSNGVKVPKGTLLFGNIQGIHRDDTYWPNALDFDPYRWERPIDKDIFYGFGAGPRICPGRFLAKYEFFV